MNKFVTHNQATAEFGLSDYVQIYPCHTHLFGVLTLENLTRTERLLSERLLSEGLLSEGLLKETLDIV